MMLTFLICHMIGISSACTNPILYGFLNENFVKEFNLLCPLLGKLTTVRADGNIIGSKKEEKKNLLTPNRKNISASTTPLLQMKSMSPISSEPTELMNNFYSDSNFLQSIRGL